MDRFLQHDALRIVHSLIAVAGRDHGRLIAAAVVGVLVQLLLLIFFRLIGIILGAVARFLAFLVGLAIAVFILEQTDRTAAAGTRARDWLSHSVDVLRRVVRDVIGQSSTKAADLSAPSRLVPHTTKRDGHVGWPLAVALHPMLRTVERLVPLPSTAAMIQFGIVTAIVVIAALVLLRIPSFPKKRVGPDLRCRPRMRLPKFKQKWGKPELRRRTEESLKPEFLFDLLHLVGMKTPIEADPPGVVIAGEDKVEMPDGKPGYLDLRVARCVLELKRPGTSLDEALDQLQRYCQALPSLIVGIAANFDRIAVYIRSSGLVTGEPDYSWTLETLDRRAVRILRRALLEPDRLRPPRRHFWRRGPHAPTIKPPRRRHLRRQKEGV